MVDRFGNPVDGFNPLTGISSILTKRNPNLKREVLKKFQSPDGDFVYSDLQQVQARRCARTAFQSPDGDFVYSDTCLRSPRVPRDGSFQSPDGDFVYSDLVKRVFRASGEPWVSIP